MGGNPVVTSGTDIPMGLIFGIINILYPIIISVIAIVMTTLDKKYAEKGGWRISERSLFLVAILGGALAMYITMKIIRHKTQHKRFMIGLPIIIAVHIFLILGIPFLILLSMSSNIHKDLSFHHVHQYILLLHRNLGISRSIF